MPGVVAPLPLVEHHPCRIEDAVVAPSGSPRGARAVLPRQPRPSKRRQGAPRRPRCWLGVEGHSRTLAQAAPLGPQPVPASARIWRNPLGGRKVWREESDDKDVRPRSRAYRRARNDNTGRCRDLHPSYNDHRAPRRRLAAYWGRSSYAALRTAVRADALCPVWDVSGACTSGCAAQAGAVRVPRIHARCDRRIHADPSVRDPTGASFASGLLQGLRLVRAVRRLAHRRRERFLRTDASRPPLEITPARLPGSAVAASPSLRVAAMNGHPKNRSVERHSRTLAQAV